MQEKQEKKKQKVFVTTFKFKANAAKLQIIEPNFTTQYCIIVLILLPLKIHLNEIAGGIMHIITIIFIAVGSFFVIAHIKS